MEVEEEIDSWLQEAVPERFKSSQHIYRAIKLKMAANLRLPDYSSKYRARATLPKKQSRARSDEESKRQLQMLRLQMQSKELGKRAAISRQIGRKEERVARRKEELQEMLEKQLQRRAEANAALQAQVDRNRAERERERERRHNTLQNLRQKKFRKASELRLVLDLPQDQLFEVSRQKLLEEEERKLKKLDEIRAKCEKHEANIALAKEEARARLEARANERRQKISLMQAGRSRQAYEQARRIIRMHKKQAETRQNKAGLQELVWGEVQARRNQSEARQRQVSEKKGEIVRMTEVKNILQAEKTRLDVEKARARRIEILRPLEENQIKKDLRRTFARLVQTSQERLRRECFLSREQQCRADPPSPQSAGCKLAEPREEGCLPRGEWEGSKEEQQFYRCAAEGLMAELKRAVALGRTGGQHFSRIVEEHDLNFNQL